MTHFRSLSRHLEQLSLFLRKNGLQANDEIGPIIAQSATFIFLRLTR